jgi:lipid-A-disaccharide synthase
VKSISRRVDRMLVILPFEEDLYRDAGVPVEFVGHPLLDDGEDVPGRDAFAARHGLDVNEEWIGLLPGSRRLEVERLLPPMLEAARLLGRPGRRFLVPVAPSTDRRLYEESMSALEGDVQASISLVDGGYAGLIRHARAAAVCSGTATLETAAAGTPLVVVYRTSWLTYNLGRLLVRIPDIALVNVVAGCRIVPELLQRDVTGERIAGALAPLLDDGTARDAMLDALRSVRQRLGTPGASVRAARAVLAAVDAAQGSPDRPPHEGPRA